MRPLQDDKSLLNENQSLKEKNERLKSQHLQDKSEILRLREENLSLREEGLRLQRKKKATKDKVDPGAAVCILLVMIFLVLGVGFFIYSIAFALSHE